MRENLTIVLITLQVAVVAIAIATPAGIAVAWALERKRIPGRSAIEVFISLPLALPPVVIGYLLLRWTGRNSWLGSSLHGVFGIDIAFTWFAAALASAVVAFPLMVRTFMVAFASVDARLESAARTLGAGPWNTFATITLPLALPGVLAGVLIGFVRAISEFGATVIVAGNIPGETQTVSLAIFSYVSAGQDDRAVPLIAAAIVIAVVSLLLHNYLLDRLKRARSTGAGGAR